MREHIIRIGCIILVCGFLSGCCMLKNNSIQSDKKNHVIELEKIDSYPQNKTAMEDFSSVQNFAYQLFYSVFDKENPVFSPVSAYLAAGMAGTGADGDTKAEFEAVLGNDVEDISYYLMQYFQTDSGADSSVKINISNSVWLDNSIIVNSNWLAKQNCFYDSSAYQGKLSDEGVMEDINMWVNSASKGKIQELLTEPLPAETKLLFYSTLYFNGKWVWPFEASKTGDRSFTLENGDVISVQMMSESDCYRNYICDGEKEAVILPYEDSDIVFAAIKPVGNISVREMYAKTDMGELMTFLNSSQSTLLCLQLPKIDICVGGNLNDALKKTGISKAFDRETADLTGIGTVEDEENLYIDQIYQEAWICVDEEGTEASAVTEEAWAVTEELEEEPIIVKFNEPFLYLIADKEYGVPLFMGIMDNPDK